MFGIAFMVYRNDLFGVPISIRSASSCSWLAAIMTIWSMIVYLRAAWPFIMADEN